MLVVLQVCYLSLIFQSLIVAVPLVQSAYNLHDNPVLEPTEQIVTSHRSVICSLFPSCHSNYMRRVDWGKPVGHQLYCRMLDVCHREVLHSH